MQTATKTAVDTDSPPIGERIAALPENKAQRLQALEVLLAEQEGNIRAITDEIRRVACGAIEQNMNPDEKVLAGISDRYALSSEYGVSREDFDTVLAEIGANEKTLAQLRRLHATCAEMTIVSIGESEILFTDTVDSVNVEAQEEFLSGLDVNERSDAVSTLQQRFPKIEELLQRADSDNGSGLNYYEHLLLCEVTGAEPMPEAEYRILQDRKPVDRQTICWLLTGKEMLDGGVALDGDRLDCKVNVLKDAADNRNAFRAGRPQLRIQRT